MTDPCLQEGSPIDRASSEIDHRAPVVLRQKLEALLRRAEDEASLWLRNAASYRRAEPRDLDTALRCEIRAYEWECITDLLRDALDS